MIESSIVCLFFTNYNGVPLVCKEEDAIGDAFYNALVGDGTDRWLDKSQCVLLGPDGRVRERRKEDSLRQ